jgi:hypothetical protein
MRVPTLEELPYEATGENEVRVTLDEQYVGLAQAALGDVRSWRECKYTSE